MPKRKLLESNGVEGDFNGTADWALRLQRERLNAILEQAKKTLSRALKIARGFERQKLGRRQKLAKEQNEDAETVRLATEKTALKVRESVNILSIYLHFDFRLMTLLLLLSCSSTKLC